MVVIGIAIGFAFLSACGILFLLICEVGRYAEDINHGNKGSGEEDTEETRREMEKSNEEDM